MEILFLNFKNKIYIWLLSIVGVVFFTTCGSRKKSCNCNNANGITQDSDGCKANSYSYEYLEK